MRVGIVTFHNGSNYGAALQAFALQEAEVKLGNQVHIINYDNRFISKGLDRIRFGFSVLGMYSFLTDIIHYKSNGRKISRFKDFFNRYYKLSALMDEEHLKESNDIYDLGISGSDQIWNPILLGRIDDIYFLNFGNFAKKLSYASSLGNYKLDNEKYNQQIKTLLCTFSKISTREKSDVLENVIGQKVYNVCDPTLLLNKEDWAESLNLKDNAKKYLLIYTLTDYDHVIEIARKIATKRGLKMVFIGRTIHKHSDVKCVVDAGPKEFVELFYNASYIVTNSFHGTAFSINFKKQFVSVRHPKSPERAQHILNVTKLTSRLVEPGVEFEGEDIDFNMFNEAHIALDAMRKDSYNYLAYL